MESHRASPVLRNLEELGRRATDQLRNHAQLHSHYQYPNGLGGDSLSGPKRISDRPQTGPESDLLSPPQTQHHPTEMELHHCTESVKLILSCPKVRKIHLTITTVPPASTELLRQVEGGGTVAGIVVDFRGPWDFGGRLPLSRSYLRA